MKNTCIVIILDGWGIGKNDESNPLVLAKTPTLDVIQSHFPGGALTASGASIGLPWEGASESKVGHYIIGTGRNLPEDFLQISIQQNSATGTLGEALAKAGKNQMRIAETSRYREITFYLNGMRENPYENEYRVEIPVSKKSIEEDPHLMAEAITDRIMLALNDRGFDLIIANYWNADAAAQAGNFTATMRAAEIIDHEIKKLMKIALGEGHMLIILGSHGNAEMLLNAETGEPDHINNANPVPFFIVASHLEKKIGEKKNLETIGILSDVAPTILTLLGIPTPHEMTGESVLKELV